MIKNNKGFTLVELIAVIVVLLAIMLIGVPQIASTLEKQNKKDDERRKESILTAAEVYVNIKDSTASTSFFTGNCVIEINSLISGEYLKDEETILSDGSNLKTQYVKYNKTSKKFEITASKGSLAKCY